MTTLRVSTALFVAVLAVATFHGPAAASTAAPATPADGSLEALFARYETIRVTLLDDSTSGVAEAARALAHDARALADSPSALPVQNAKADEAAALLPAVADAADTVARAGDLGSVREAYYELSKLLVRFRATLHDDQAAVPAVVYCPMVKKSWLQPADARIGNPYAGQVMPGCGDFVS